MKKGDIVLIPFPFSDLSGVKNRPAIIILESPDDITICFITTQLKWQSENDLLVHPSSQNGLKKSSLIRLSKIATLDKELVIGLLGELEEDYLKQLNHKLIRILKLES